MARFVTDSLTRDPTAQEYDTYRKRSKRGDYGPPQGHGIGVVVIAVGMLIVFGLPMLFMSVVLPRLLGSSDSGFSFDFQSVFPLLWLGLVALMAVGATKRVVRSIRKRRRWASLARFAEDNELQFRLSSANPNYPGCLFSIGGSRTARNHVWSSHGQLADCGTYQWTVGSGKESTTYSWNFAAFRLPRPMPHLLLDARANDIGAHARLPVSLTAGQRLSLGSPFDEHYTLYAPEGYGQDAFYLFPPDLMSMLLDATVDFDIEIVDQWMFLYTPSKIDLTEAGTWNLLGDIEATLGARMAEQSGRYADRRLREQSPPRAVNHEGQPHYGPGMPVRSDRSIARPGRRLKQGWNPLRVLSTLASMAVFIAFTYFVILR